MLCSNSNSLSQPYGQFSQVQQRMKNLLCLQNINKTVTENIKNKPYFIQKGFLPSYLQRPNCSRFRRPKTSSTVTTRADPHFKEIMTVQAILQTSLPFVSKSRGKSKIMVLNRFPDSLQRMMLMGQMYQASSKKEKPCEQLRQLQRNMRQIQEMKLTMTPLDRKPKRRS